MNNLKELKQELNLTNEQLVESIKGAGAFSATLEDQKKIIELGQKIESGAEKNEGDGKEG